MNPRYPVYIVSKGRWESRLTVRHLEAMGVPYRIIVEAQEVPAYGAVIDRSKILVLDPAYQRAYDPCDAYGDTRTKGSGPARNFAWDHARAVGAERHWLMDDNINGFFRLNRNLKVPVSDGTVLRCMEDFVDRYANIAMAGPNYFMFASRKARAKPFILNTRIYSCNLILNCLPFRWRGRYNEDTILSLDILKAGWCTVLFNAFLQYKMPTQTMKGGNTDELYKHGTAEKSRLLARVYPEYAKVTWRFNRWHHSIDYKKHFGRNRLVRRVGEVPTGTDNYGMRLVERPGPVSLRRAVCQTTGGVGAAGPTVPKTREWQSGGEDSVFYGIESA